MFKKRRREEEEVVEVGAGGIDATRRDTTQRGCERQEGRDVNSKRLDYEYERRNLLAILAPLWRKTPESKERANRFDVAAKLITNEESLDRVR